MACEIEAVQGRTALPGDANTPADSVALDLAQSANTPQPATDPTLNDSRKLARGLALSFAVLIFILLGTTYLTLNRMRRMNESAQDTLKESLIELQLGQEGLRCSSENSRITMQIFLLRQPEVIDQLLVRQAENTRKIGAIISALEPRCNPGEETRLLKTLKETRDLYVSSYQRALHLREKKRDAATEMMVLETTPVLYRYHAAWDEFLRFQNEQVRTATEQSQQHEATAQRILLGSIIIVGAMGAVIAIFTIRRVARVVTSRIRMQEKLYELNAELEQRVGQRTQELQDYTKDMVCINELVELLQSCLTMEEARQQASRILQQFFPSGAMLMLNSSRNLLDVVLSWGTAAVKPGPFAPESCWAMRKGCAHVVQPNNFSLACGHVDQASASCHLCVPMVAQGDSLGVLSIDDPQLCDSAHPRLLQRKKELATTVAEQISLAFANLTLRETLKYQAVRDPLTGLFNRRHMEEALERELLRAARNAKPVTVLMVDIDHFKRFNDTYGHDAGDVALRELGTVFTSVTRGGDIACRYGGEEFLLILADASLQTGYERGVKLKEQVASLQVHYHGEVLPGITVSVGVAAFPEHGITVGQIVRVADQALYRAKADGRDRVVMADATNIDTPSLSLSVST